MRKLMALLLALSGAMLVLMSASADSGKKDCDPANPRCEAWTTGKGSPPGGPSDCYLQIVAHVRGGKVSVDMWREKTPTSSRWGGIPRIKTAGKDEVEVRWKVGCHFVTSGVTKWIYFCNELVGEKPHYFIKELTPAVRAEALRTKRLDVCIGPQCKRG